MRKLSRVACLVVLGACTTPNVAYHPADPDLPPSPVHVASNADLYFIELDDMGLLQSEAQLRQALDAIRAVQGGALVITYVHGWNHNADSSDDNLQGFIRTFVRRFADQEELDARACNAKAGDAKTGKVETRKVIALYVGWRGKLFTPNVPGIFVASYFNRDAAAERVARPTGAEVLAAITRAARSKPENRSIVIGHSMGGLIVEASLIPALQEVLENAAVRSSSPEGDASTPRAEMPVDLVILINPASRALEATKFDLMLDRWSAYVDADPSPYRIRPTEGSTKRVPERAPDQQYVRTNDAWRPLIISLTSKGDSNTGFDFTLGNTLSSVTKRFRLENVGPFPNEKSLYRHTAGHTEELFTHTVDYRCGEECGAEEGAVTPSEPVTKCLEVAPAKGAATACVMVGSDRFIYTQRPPKAPAVPYWIMPISEDLVKDHTHFFNPRFYRLVKGLLALTGGFQRAHYQGDDSLWGVPVPPATIHSALPTASKPLPTDLEVVATCPMGDLCTTGDAVTFTLRRRASKVVSTYEASAGQGLSDIGAGDFVVWSLPGLGPIVRRDWRPLTVDATELSLDSRGVLNGYVTVSNRLGEIVAPIVVSLPVATPIPITYRCVATPCRAAEKVELIVETAFQGDGFTWRVDGVEDDILPHEPKITVVPSRSGQLLVHVRYSQGHDFGAGDTRLDIAPALCQPPDSKPIIKSEKSVSAACALGDTACLPVGMQLFSAANYSNEPKPDCYTFSWEVDGRISTSERFFSELTAGSHDVTLSVSAKGETKSVTQTFNVCPPPPPVSIFFNGQVSGCTQASVCGAGPYCLPGERIDFRIEPRTGCEKNVTWTFSNGDRSTSSSPFTTPGSPDDFLATAEVKADRGTSTAQTVLHFRPSCVPPCPTQPLPFPCQLQPCQPQPCQPQTVPPPPLPPSNSTPPVPTPPPPPTPPNCHPWTTEMKIVLECSGGDRCATVCDPVFKVDAFNAACDHIVWIYDDGRTVETATAPVPLSPRGKRHITAVITREGEGLRTLHRDYQLPLHKRRCAASLDVLTEEAAP
jgi:hypothetical protein